MPAPYTSAQDQWGGWLEQGYIPYSGWNPEGYQVGVAERYGLTGPGGAFREETDPGGFALATALTGGLAAPFLLGRESQADRGGQQWKVESEQDILDYLAFANEMATHNKDRLGKLGVLDYTGQDVADFFQIPGEKSRVEAAKAQTLQDIQRAGALASSESGKYGTSIYGGSPGLLGAQEGTAAKYAQPSHEGVLTSAAYEMAKGIEGGPRTGAIQNLLMAAELGGGAHIGGQETMAEAAKAPLALGVGGIGSGQPIAMLAGGATAAGALPFVIGGTDQANLARDALTRKRVSLNPSSVVMPSWSARLRPAGQNPIGTSRPYGSNQTALSGIYQDSGRGQQSDGPVWG